MSNQEFIRPRASRVRMALRVAFWAISFVGLGAILVEEVLPESIAKPIVVGTVLLLGTYLAWNFRLVWRTIHR